MLRGSARDFRWFFSYPDLRLLQRLVAGREAPRDSTADHAEGCNTNADAGCSHGSSQWSTSRNANSAIRYTIE